MWLPEVIKVNEASWVGPDPNLTSVLIRRGHRVLQSGTAKGGHGRRQRLRSKERRLG